MPAKNFTQEDIAMFINASRGFVGQVESPNSESKYNLNHLNKLALETAATECKSSGLSGVLHNVPGLGMLLADGKRYRFQKEHLFVA